jgi:hypothetical protein
MGSGFMTSSAVTWNGTQHASTFVSATQTNPSVLCRMDSRGYFSSLSLWPLTEGLTICFAKIRKHSGDAEESVRQEPSESRTSPVRNPTSVYCIVEDG